MSIRGKDDHTPLHFAKTISRIQLPNLFSFHTEIEINMEDDEGKTTLHAIENDCESSLNMLLSQQEIGINTTDPSFLTPF